MGGAGIRLEGIEVPRLGVRRVGLESVGRRGWVLVRGFWLVGVGFCGGGGGFW